MKPTLYMVNGSHPVGAVQITAKAIGVPLNEKEVDFLNNQHLTPEFLKFNPQHTVPTLIDTDGFTIWDSHAIITYLASKYAKSDSLYPKDLKTRAMIDQRLHFESNVLSPVLDLILRPLFHEKKLSIDEKDVEGVITVYKLLEAFLDGNQWIATDFLTLADYSLIPTVICLHSLIPVDGVKFPKLFRWLTKCQRLPEFDAFKKGLDAFNSYVKPALQYNKQ